MNRISPKASIYGNLELGDTVRIDDFCIITGDVKIGNNVHIASYTFISGGNGVVIEDYVQVAPRVNMLTGSDDYSGLSLVGPCIPDEFKPGLDRGPIRIERHALLGASTIVMPYVNIGEGACTGAFTFVKSSLMPWSMYVGCPARYLKPRSKYMLQLEKEYEQSRMNDTKPGEKCQLPLLFEQYQPLSLFR